MSLSVGKFGCTYHRVDPQTWIRTCGMDSDKVFIHALHSNLLVVNSIVVMRFSFCVLQIPVHPTLSPLPLVDASLEGVSDEFLGMANADLLMLLLLFENDSAWRKEYCVPHSND
jgi:hypothetical protein